MDIRMIVMDLDGTLLNLDKQISKRNLAALEACAQRGIHIVLASGRSFEAVRRIAIEAKLNCAIASVNGARLDLSSEGPQLYARTFTRELATRVFDIMKRSGIYFTCYGNGALYKNNTFAASDRTSGTKRSEGQLAMQTHRAERIISDESQTCAEGLNSPYKFVAFSEDMPKLHALRDALKASGLPINVSSSWIDNVEVMVESAGKDVAVRALCARYGITSEQVMAFGDNINDIDMLGAVGVPVAMENALPELKACARIIAPHHDCSGVASVIDEYVLKDATQP